VIVRIRNLLVPYSIWSLVIFFGDALQGLTYIPVEYLERLSLGRATRAYFYVPLLCQFYLLSPLVAPIAKTRGKLVLLTSALLQLTTISLRYLVAYGVDAPALDSLIRVTPVWSFPRWAFFFVVGLVSSFHLAQLKQWLSRFKWALLFAVVLMGLLAILEPHAPLDPTGYEWGRSVSSISSQLYAVAFILCFLAFDKVTIPGSKTVHQLGKSSYGIYLLHPKVLEFIARVVRQITPWILAYQIVFCSSLVVVGVGVPFLFMTAVSKSPARRAYRYLFG
jgi:peptidoglycan/LPS O-acetylase OafA/YrhL